MFCFDWSSQQEYDYKYTREYMYKNYQQIVYKFCYQDKKDHQLSVRICFAVIESLEIAKWIL